MKILFCVEYYYPSLGGAQEVVRQIAERMVLRGHDVTVATSRVKSRGFDSYNGVRIAEFPVSGNNVSGLSGAVGVYRRYLAEGDFDLIFFYAAQQWTFDAAWPVLGAIRAKKVFVPCGYSGLYNPSYRDYFRDLPGVLRQCDQIVYHASDYRDVAYGKANHIEHSVLIPNGADDHEFSVGRDCEFRKRHDIPSDAVVLLTVGTVTGQKGHVEVLDAFERADFGDRAAILFLNGNDPEYNGEVATLMKRFSGLRQLYGLKYAVLHELKSFIFKLGFKVGRSTSIREKAALINKLYTGRKRVITCNLSRKQLIQAYLNSDIFVFASNVEYSPLVLFESCAAGLPFLSVPVGNSEEIARWTGGGVICPARIDEHGYTRVDTAELARRIETLLQNEKQRQMLGQSGRLAWQRRYNWSSLSGEYEAIFTRLTECS